MTSTMTSDQNSSSAHHHDSYHERDPPPALSSSSSSASSSSELLEEEEERLPSSERNTTTDRLQSCWEPSKTGEEFYLPSVDVWHYQKDIKNRQGDVIYRLLHEERIGQVVIMATTTTTLTTTNNNNNNDGGGGEPILRMVIGNPEREVVAAIVRQIQRGKDRYVIYGRIPPHPPSSSSSSSSSSSPRTTTTTCSNGSTTTTTTTRRRRARWWWWRRRRRTPSSSSSYSFEFQNEELEVYPMVSVEQGVLGKRYTVQSMGERKDIRWTAENGGFRKTMMFLPCVIAWGLFRWNFEFYDDLINSAEQDDGKWGWGRRLRISPQGSHHENKKHPIMSRDQEFCSVSVSADGASPLLGLCVAYALDRMTRPMIG